MIIVTGASRGIGKFLFESLKSSDKVIGTYLSTKPESIKDLDFLYKVDVSKYESVAQFINVIKNDLTEIVLLNCAGISYNSFTHKSDPEKWKKVIDVNLIGTYHMIRAILPIMREQNYGRIINFSSVIAQKGTPGVSAYAASKAGLWGMTRSLAQENGSMGITVNNINLGYVSLGMGVEQVPLSFQDSIKNQIPSRQFCEPNDIYNTVNYLINTPYVNGTSIDLNGGLF
ncbi:MAG: SDR family NAD(P)-dependent oxidoreductase [Bacteroidales bacterium]|nr:SDR family NAD(P)-dependent oxidoreductase [Bacteroidales bacterium]